MKKYYKLLSGALVVSMLFSNSIPVFASQLTNDGLKEQLPNIVFSNIERYSISPEKEKYLQDMRKEYNLTQQDVNDIRYIYNQYSDISTPRAKIGIIKKVIKVAGPVLMKAAKIFGVKMSEKSFAEFSNFLFGWQDDLQSGIETFLVNNLHWNRVAAEWTAKTIMFVVF